MYVPSLIEHCDAVDLDIDARSVRYAAGTSSRYFLSGHVFAKGFIEAREIGDRWVQERRSAVLALPSAISPADTNFLLNPEHPDFKRIHITSPIDFEFDPRLHGR